MDALYRFSQGLYFFILRVIAVTIFTFLSVVAIIGFAILASHYYLDVDTRFSKVSLQQEEGALESPVMNEQ